MTVEARAEDNSRSSASTAGGISWASWRRSGA
jgi:hypothetical protein